MVLAGKRVLLALLGALLLVGSARLLAVLLLVALTGCLGAPTAWNTDTPPLFTFALLADPHVGRADGEGRLRSCVDWLNQHRAAEGIELAFVLGDVGERLDLAADVLSNLDVPWVPVIGDGAVQEGREAEFRERFGPQMERVGQDLDGWRWTRGVPLDPRTGTASHLHSFAFEHRGVHFLGLDWCTRERGDIVSEQADIHAFDGGTWPFFRDTLEAWRDAGDDSIVLLSHHPMHAALFGLGSFSAREMGAVEALTGPRAAALHANFAGHYHVNWQEDLPRAGYRVYVTETLEEGPLTIRLVRVHRTSGGFSYEHRLVDARVSSAP